MRVFNVQFVVWLCEISNTQGSNHTSGKQKKTKLFVEAGSRNPVPTGLVRQTLFQLGRHLWRHSAQKNDWKRPGIRS